MAVVDPDLSQMPEVYYMEEMEYEDRYKMYAEEFLGRALNTEVENAFIRKVLITVEPLGWKAIWRSSFNQHPYDYEVEVIEVSQLKLEAHVNILRRVSEFDAEINIAVHSNLVSSIRVVTLLEIYPIYIPNNEEMEKIATTLETIRFFYNHIWRPWDADEEEDYIFVDKYLGPRLKIYYDISSGVISAQTADKMRRVLDEAKEVQLMIKRMQRKLGETEEIDEKEFRKCLSLNHHLEELQRKFQLLENPEIAVLMSPRGYSSDLSGFFMENAYDADRHTHHIVATEFSVQLLQPIMDTLPKETIVKFYNKFEDSLHRAGNNDTIMVCPGNYSCSGFNWLERSIKIVGVGKEYSETVINFNEPDGVFLNIKAAIVNISNISISIPQSATCGLLIHSGITEIQKCSISGGITCIVVTCDATIDMKDCLISKARCFGVDLRSGSNGEMVKNLFKDCKLAGIALQAIAEIPEMVYQGDVTLHENTFLDSKCGVVVTSAKDLSNIKIERDLIIPEWLEENMVLASTNMFINVKYSVSVLLEADEAYDGEKMLLTLKRCLKA